jgi:hypothetical protein
MFNWTTTQRNKGRLKQLIIEFTPSTDEEGNPVNYNGDLMYEVGHMEGSDFVVDEVHTIQSTSTIAEAKQAIEDLLVSQLGKAST